MSTKSSTREGSCEKSRRKPRRKPRRNTRGLGKVSIVVVGGDTRHMLGSGAFGSVHSMGPDVACKTCSFAELSWIREALIPAYLRHALDDVKDGTDSPRISDECIINYTKISVVYDYPPEDGNYGNKKTECVQFEMPRYPATIYDLTVFDDASILLILNHLAAAISIAHVMRIIHRDIKERNILLKFDSEDQIIGAVLADYGLSTYAPAMCDSNPAYEVITISHRPPELGICLEGTPQSVAEYYTILGSATQEPGTNMVFHYDSRIDVWSFGIVLLYLLTGKSFYAYIIGQNLDFLSVTRIPSSMKVHIDKFLAKHINPELSHVKFYMDVLERALMPYELRNHMNAILQFMVDYTGSLPHDPDVMLVKSRGHLYDIHIGADLGYEPVYLTYAKKSDSSLIVRALRAELRSVGIDNFCDINFSNAFTEVTVPNPAVFSAMTNLYKHVSVACAASIEKLLGAEIQNILCLLPVCWVIVSCVLTDSGASDELALGLVEHEFIKKLMCHTLSELNYNAIPLFGLRYSTLV